MRRLFLVHSLQCVGRHDLGYRFRVSVRDAEQGSRRGREGHDEHTLREVVLARISFVELPVTDLAATETFYATVFAWDLTSFGPSYACTMTGDVDLGLQGDPADATRAPLAVIAVEDLDAALAAVTRHGGTITRPIFAFPGGRRFHFLDPSGNELAALKSD